MKPQELVVHTRVEIEGVIQGITVSPGETLVLSFRHQLSMQEAEEIVDRLKGLLPGVVVVLVDGDVRLTVMPHSSDDLRDMISEMMIDKFRQLAQEHGLIK